jgi:hypothetical protein
MTDGDQQSSLLRYKINYCREKFYSKGPRMFVERQDTRNNDTQHNDIKHNDIQQNIIKHNDTQ